MTLLLFSGSLEENFGNAQKDLDKITQCTLNNYKDLNERKCSYVCGVKDSLDNVCPKINYIRISLVSINKKKQIFCS